MNTMSRMNGRVRRGAAVCAALVAIAGAVGPAFGQSAAGGQPGKKSDEYSKPLRAAKAPAGGNVQMHLSETDGDDRYEVVIRGSEVSAKVNGKAVPEDRIRREDDRISILDEDGKVVKEFNVGGMGGGAWAPKAPRSPRVQVAPKGNTLRWLGGGQGGAQGLAQAMPAPKVMIGITMAEPDEEQAKEAGGEAGQGVLIASVIDGLPADKAGLKQGDIITSIDGSDGPLDQQKFREVINKKDPGDTVSLTVLRGGDKKSFDVKLKQWDAEKLGVGSAPMAIEVSPEDGEGGGHWTTMSPEQQKWIDQWQRERQARRRAPDAGGDRPEPRERPGRMAPGDGPDDDGAPEGGPPGFVFRGEPGDWDVFMQPFQGMQGRSEDLNRRLDELQERLDRLNEKLDRMAETLEKVAGKK